MTLLDAELVQPKLELVSSSRKPFGTVGADGVAVAAHNVVVGALAETAAAAAVPQRSCRASPQCLQQHWSRHSLSHCSTAEHLPHSARPAERPSARRSHCPGKQIAAHWENVPALCWATLARAPILFRLVEHSVARCHMAPPKVLRLFGALQVQDWEAHPSAGPARHSYPFHPSQAMNSPVHRLQRSCPEDVSCQ